MDDQWEDASFDDPSSVDLERLDHEAAYCPECGAEVWDDAQSCPTCGAYFSIPTGRPPAHQAARHLVTVLLVVLAAIGLLLLIVLAL